MVKVKQLVIKNFIRFIQQLIIFSLVLVFLFSGSCFAQSFNEEKDIIIYKVNPAKLDSFEVLKQGTVVNFILNNEVSSKDTKPFQAIHLTAQDNNKNQINAKGLVTYSSMGGIFSQQSFIQISLKDLNSSTGEQLAFPATSSLFSKVHPPHANTSSIGLARTITNLSLATSPATLGASLGISFLTGGLLSSYKNGVKDFIWGGFNGSGLSLVESLFRKQPETFLKAGTVIPFSLNQDIKISQGIKVEDQNDRSYLSEEEAVDRIKTLFKWGDLAGALELAAESNQSETYNELLETIFSK